MESDRPRSIPQLFRAVRLLRQRLSRLATRVRRNGEKMSRPMVTYKPSDEVDFVIIGSGAAGRVLATELSTNGFRVPLPEQHAYRQEKDLPHPEPKIFVRTLPPT